MDVNGTIPSVNCVDLQCSQADADLEILTAVTQNVTTYYASVENQEDPFVNLLLKLAELPTNASVVVVAFTTLEVLVHNSILEAFSLEIMKLALKGVTVVTSAGDSGASGPYCWCSSDDFKWRYSTSATVYCNN
jgi:subtilase family serine protease